MYVYIYVYIYRQILFMYVVRRSHGLWWTRGQPLAEEILLQRLPVPKSAISDPSWLVSCSSFAAYPSLPRFMTLSIQISPLAHYSPFFNDHFTVVFLSCRECLLLSLLFPLISFVVLLIERGKSVSYCCCCCCYYWQGSERIPVERLVWSENSFFLFFF